jgi:hypothetical protein
MFPAPFPARRRPAVAKIGAAASFAWHRCGRMAGSQHVRVNRFQSLMAPQRMM